jgi:copper(I)-binding protein
MRWWTPAALVLVASACGSAGGAEFAAGGAWARPTPAGASDGVVYLTVSTDEPDELVGASVAGVVAREAQLHMTSVGDEDHSHHGGAGAASVSMGDVESIPLAAGATVVFEPGGSHIMLVGLAAPLQRGSTFMVALEFASGRVLDTEVVVADNPPG